jgi:hypothetical protein
MSGVLGIGKVAVWVPVVALPAECLIRRDGLWFGLGLSRSYVIQGMRMLAVTWANDVRGKSVFWLHAAVRRGI